MGALAGAHRQHPTMNPQMGASRNAVKLQCKKDDVDCDFVIERFEKSDQYLRELKMDSDEESDSEMPSGRIEFTLEKPKYDQDTFTGRFLATAET